ncbi:MAG TPA: hypothetical protein VG146_14535 [Verrucomicrobiae bacterium]|nr:hypothetical protein [Verrucomicrobiae bacterium]
MKNLLLAAALAPQFQFKGSSKKLLLALLPILAVVVGYFCWEYYKEWKIKRFYASKPWKGRKE